MTRDEARLAVEMMDIDLLRSWSADYALFVEYLDEPGTYDWIRSDKTSFGRFDDNSELFSGDLALRLLLFADDEDLAELSQLTVAEQVEHLFQVTQ